MGTKRLVLVIVVALVLMPMGTMGLPSAAPSHEQSATPASNVGTAATQNESSPTVITGCTVINESGHYILGENITVNTDTDCIYINASDVTLDGNGHTIDGATGDIGTAPISTIRLESLEGPQENDWSVPVRSNITITNLHITNAGLGIKLGKVNDVTVSDTQVDAQLTAIKTQRVTNATITDNHVTDAGRGLGIINSTDVTANDNTLTLGGGNPGIHVAGDSANIALRNNRVENVERGVGIGGVDGLTIESNTFKNVNRGVVQIGKQVEDSDVDDIAIHRNNFLEVSPDAYGVQNNNPAVVNATHNYWGAADGPSSTEDADEPLKDPITGEPADGNGTTVSAFLTDECVVTNESNVHFDPWLTSPTNETTTT